MLCSCDSRRVTRGFGVDGVMYIIWRMFAFFGLSQYVKQGSSAFFSCALTVDVIDLLFLRQCFIRLRMLLHHQLVAIRGTEVRHLISLRLCQVTFARVLLEHIVPRARWRCRIPWHALQVIIVQAPLVTSTHRMQHDWSLFGFTRQLTVTGYGLGWFELGSPFFLASAAVIGLPLSV